MAREKSGLVASGGEPLVTWQSASGKQAAVPECIKDVHQQVGIA